MNNLSLLILLCFLSVSDEVHCLDKEELGFIDDLRPWPNQKKIFIATDWLMYFKAAKFFQSLPENDRIEFIEYVRDHKGKDGSQRNEIEYVDEGNRRLIIILRISFKAEEITRIKSPAIVGRLTNFVIEINIDKNDKIIDNFGWPIRWDNKFNPSLIQGFSGRGIYDALTEYNILKDNSSLRDIRFKDG